MASRHASLSGNIALDAQAHGIFLLHQENAQTAKIWPMSTIKKVEVVPTDIPQDSEKILSIVIKDPTKGYVTIQWAKLIACKIVFDNQIRTDPKEHGCILKFPLFTLSGARSKNSASSRKSLWTSWAKNWRPCICLIKTPRHLHCRLPRDWSVGTNQNPWLTSTYNAR